MSVCLLLATSDRYSACGFPSLFLCIHVSTSVQTVTAEKLTGFQLTNSLLHCMEPELYLPYIMLKSTIKVLQSLKSGKTEFKDCNLISRI